MEIDKSKIIEIIEREKVRDAMKVLNEAIHAEDIRRSDLASGYVRKLQDIGSYLHIIR